MPPAALHRGMAVASVAIAAAILGTIAAALVRSPVPTPGAAAGQSVYEAKCASCHGPDGMGDGPAAAMLAVAPRDFTRGVYKFRSTPSGSLPTDDDLLRVVAEGIPGTSMIGWKAYLSEAEMRGAVEYLKRFSPRFATESPTPVTLAPEPPASAASIETGRQLYASLQCGACHGEAGHGAAAVAGSFEDDWGHPLKPAALTEPWTFRGGSTPRDIAMRLKTGIDGTPMPSMAGVASDQDLWNLAHYIRSIARTPVWEMSADELTARYADEAREHEANPVERGRQLAEVCAHCHSPVEKDGRIIPGLKFAGGQRFTLSVWGDVVTANLTSDKDTGLGSYTDDEILRVVTRGIRRDGSRMLPFPMGWTAWAHLPEADQKALVAFLRTIPAVRNAIPPREPPGFFTYLAGKFRMLVLGVDAPMVVYAGNAGRLSEGQVR